MNGQIVRWGMAFAATVTLSASILFSAAKAPAPAAAETTVVKRDPATVSDLELELILNKIREGDLLSQRNEFATAKRAWLEARRAGEGLWPIHEGLGDSYARAKLYEEALREYLIAGPLVPEKYAVMRATISAKRAGVLAATGRSLEAIQGYLELNQPAQVGSHILALADSSNSVAAAKLVSDRAEVYDPRLFLLLSRLEAKLGHKTEAAEALAKFSMTVAPWEGALNRQAIEGLRGARKFDLALEVCRAWARSTPQALEAYVLMGDLYRESGREKEAIIAYTSIVEMRPGDAGAHRQLGDIFRGMNRPDEALTQYEAAKKARPEDQATYTALVALYDGKGDKAKSEATMIEATKRFGLSSELRSRLVSSYQDEITTLKAAGKPDEVRALRRKLASLNVAEAGLFDLKVIMTWDVESDVDLDVFEPGGEHIEHSHPHSKLGGHYYVDNTKGFGPETYTLPSAPPGTYRIGAHLHGDRRSTVKFVVILYEDTPREERREETLVIERGAEIKYIREVVITK
jgi:tetratricopeptide (TPR) repeat protein